MQYENWQHPAGRQNKYALANSFYDLAGTAHETALSPRAIVTHEQRWRWSISMSKHSGGGGADDPDSYRLYVADSDTDPGASFASYKRQGTTLATNFATMATFDSATTGAKDADFPNAIPGKVVPHNALTTHAELQGNGDGFMPIGAVIMFGGAAAPTGWLLCQGQAVSRTTYADLFGILGTTYGVGDGTTTFNLPDLRSRLPIGAGSYAALAGNEGSIEVNRTLRHTHGLTGQTGTDTGTARSVGTGAANAADKGHTHGISAASPTGDGGAGIFAHLAVNFIIKT